MDDIKRERVKGGDAPASGRYMVFCADGEVYGEEGRIFSTHEADVTMIATAGEVERRKLTPAEARKLLEPKDTLTPRSFFHTSQWRCRVIERKNRQSLRSTVRGLDGPDGGAVFR